MCERWFMIRLRVQILVLLLMKLEIKKKKKQMAIILHFIDKNGFIQEYFFHVMNMKDIMILILKQEVCNVLSRHDILIGQIQDQGYDSTRNTWGEWNGLQTLLFKDFPFIYYVHCLAYKVQLTFTFAFIEVKLVHQLFTNLIYTINIVVSSCKRNEVETVKRANQGGTLHWSSNTWWGSHFQ